MLLDLYIWLEIIVLVVLEIKCFAFYFIRSSRIYNEGWQLTSTGAPKTSPYGLIPDITFSVFVFSLLFQKLVEFTYIILF